MIKESDKSEKPGHDLYLQGKAAELAGDLNTAIIFYKKAEKLGHDLVDDGSAVDTGEKSQQKTFEDLENSETGLFDPLPASKQVEPKKSKLPQSSGKLSVAGFKLFLVDLQKPLCEELKKQFMEWQSDVQVVCGRFETLPEFDCMVSAGNSFGLMDGGVDAAITSFFGEQLMRRVQQHIVDNFDGEQPVGSSFIIETNHPKHPFLAHTPTMVAYYRRKKIQRKFKKLLRMIHERKERVPYSIRGTDYVYLAMKAMLNAVRKHNRSNEGKRKPIRSVACTGLGTFYGKMEFPEAARQMALAYRNFLHVPKKLTWSFAAQRQEAVGYGGYEGLKKVGPPSADTLQSRKDISQTMSDLAQKTAHLNE